MPYAGASSAAARCSSPAFSAAWVLGTLLLGLSKILENMELGHNVMHGQYDWMQDPGVPLADLRLGQCLLGRRWRHSHNYQHHTFTNILGRDRDLGYGFLRLFPEQPWHPAHLLQPPISLLLALGFEWGVALHDLELERGLRGEKSLGQILKELPPVLRKARRQPAQGLCDLPAAGRSVLPAGAGRQLRRQRDPQRLGLRDHLLRHFTEHVETFPESVLETETRARVVRAAAEGFEQSERWPAVSRPERQPQLPDRASPLSERARRIGTRRSRWR